MKTRDRVGLGCVMSVALTAWTADIQKEDNDTPLDDPASWVGGTAHVAVHDPATQSLRLKPKHDRTVLIIK